MWPSSSVLGASVALRAMRGGINTCLGSDTGTPLRARPPRRLHSLGKGPSPLHDDFRRGLRRESRSSRHRSLIVGVYVCVPEPVSIDQLLRRLEVIFCLGGESHE